jgi:hypothetical protein
MRESYLFPMIDMVDRRPVFSEITYRRQSSFRRIKRTEFDPLDRSESINVEYEEFKLHEFSYQVDAERLCYVEIYVHQDFAWDAPKKHREQILRDFVHSHAAWFFTYGTRRIEKLHGLIK